MLTSTPIRLELLTPAPLSIVVEVGRRPQALVLPLGGLFLGDLQRVPFVLNRIRFLCSGVGSLVINADLFLVGTGPRLVRLFAGYFFVLRLDAGWPRLRLNARRRALRLDAGRGIFSPGSRLRLLRTARVFVFRVHFPVFRPSRQPRGPRV